MAGRAAFAANQKQAPGFVVGPNGLWLEKITEGRGGWEGVPAAPINRGVLWRVSVGLWLHWRVSVADEAVTPRKA